MTSSTRARAGALVLSLVAVATCSTVLASADEQDAAIAETLFRQGKALMALGDYANGCPKLAESQRLDPSAGTLLALALCHERSGALATAWAKYIEAAAAADRAGQNDRAQAARERSRAIEPKLPHLALGVSPPARDVRGLEIRLDGVVIGRAAWGVPSPVDPGPHDIRAQAPGHLPWSTRVEARSGESTSVVVPELPPTPRPPPPAIATVPPPARDLEHHPEHAPSSAAHTAGFVLGAAGIAGLAVGTVFGVRALVLNDQAHQLCPAGSPCTNARAGDLNSAAKGSATVSTISFVLGGALAGAGLVLLLTSRSASSGPSPTSELYLVPDYRGASLTWRGSW